MKKNMGVIVESKATNTEELLCIAISDFFETECKFYSQSEGEFRICKHALDSHFCACAEAKMDALTDKRMNQK